MESPRLPSKRSNSPKSHRSFPTSSIHVVNAHVHAGVVLIREANEHKCVAHVPTASAKGEGTIAIFMVDTFMNVLTPFHHVLRIGANIGPQGTLAGH
jgi:hypothetical protein